MKKTATVRLCLGGPNSLSLSAVHVPTATEVGSGALSGSQSLPGEVSPQDPYWHD